MAYHYSDSSRESDPYALPNIETFYHQHGKRERMMLNAGHVAEMYGECVTDEEGDCLGTGWYWQACFPGCLPDGDPMGPFATEAEALADAREGMED